MKNLLFLALFPCVALAGEATLTWTAPTKNTDGSAYTNPGGYKIYYGIGGVTKVIDIPDSAKTSYIVTNLADGTWTFTMTAYSSTGVESDKSNTVSKSITSPLPPNLTFVTVEPQVYNVIKRENAFIFIYVGTVPLSTPCDKNNMVNGKYVVPVSAVTWAGTVKPAVVVATCSEK